MKRYAAEEIRNVAIVAHGGAGKTSLAEAMLYVAGAIDRQGRVDDGTTVTDFDSEEIRRKVSIQCAIAILEWRGMKVNLVDVPGYADFAGEAAGALRAVDGAIFVASAQASGIDVGFQVAWEYAEAEKIARCVFVNKMDKEHSDFFRIVDSLRSRYGKAIAAAEIPIGVGEQFHGVVDLVHRKAYVFVAGEKVDHPDGVPAELEETVEKYRELLIESAVENDDELLEKYLAGETLSAEEIERGLHEGMVAGAVVPVTCGAALKDMGVRFLLDLICDEFPSPAERPLVPAAQGSPANARKPECNESLPLIAQVFKTVADPYVGKLSYFRVYSGALRSDSSVFNPRTGREERVGQVYVLRGKQQIAVQEIAAGDIGAVPRFNDVLTGDTLCDAKKPVELVRIDHPEPVYAVAITAKTKVDEDKLGPALRRLQDENPAFEVRRDAQTGETLMVAAGETHIEVLVERLKRFGAQVEMALPSVPYLETVTGTAKAEGRHKKQTGGRGQYGDCWIEIEPLERGAGFQFIDAVVGGAIPRQFIPAVEKGIRDAMARGTVSGNPVVDIRVKLYDGKYHDVDSSEAAFKIAGSLAFHNAVALAHPAILEPIVSVDVRVPEEYLGDCIGDLNSRRGHVLGMERIEGRGSVDAMQLVHATVPQRELLRYAIDLRSLTHGRGSFTTLLSHYQEAPALIAQAVIAEAKDRGFTTHHEA